MENQTKLIHLKRYFDTLKDLNVPIGDIAVSYKGKIIYRDRFGYTDSAKTKPVQPDTMYWVYSATKIVTCVAAMKLVEEGKMSLDDPVYKFIPEYKNITVRDKEGNVTPAKNVMTIEHLFTMTGGMDYDTLGNPEVMAMFHDRTLTTLDVARYYAVRPLWFEPGTHYKYSMCHDVLAAVVSVVSGKSFANYVKENIFLPLGITENATFHPTDEEFSRVSDVYHMSNGSFRLTPARHENQYALCPGFESGGAGLCASVDSYLPILQMLSNRGVGINGVRVLKEETVMMMTEPRLCPDALDDFATGQKLGYSWGLCGRVNLGFPYCQSLSPKGEFGWDGALNAFAVVDPFNDVAIFYASSTWGFQYGYNMIHRRMRDLVYYDLGLGDFVLHE